MISVFCSPKSPEANKKKGKTSRVWDNAGTNKDIVNLDFTDKSSGDATSNNEIILPSNEEVSVEL